MKMFQINRCRRTYPRRVHTETTPLANVEFRSSFLLGEELYSSSYFGTLAPYTLNALIWSPINSLCYGPTSFLGGGLHYIFVLV